jgi:hypothetical protein
VSEICFRVAGYPPAKNEALSMLGRGHAHSPRVRALLEAARGAVDGTAFVPFSGPIGLRALRCGGIIEWRIRSGNVR